MSNTWIKRESPEKSGHPQSDGTSHNSRIGEGGIDSHLRYRVIESMPWICQIPLPRGRAVQSGVNGVIRQEQQRINSDNNVVHEKK
ncbi:MAG: hypothetical protein WC869_05880 [Phycisphaerae bacterium]|jgi:hypothetical protein